MDLLRHQNIPHLFQTAARPSRTREFISKIIANEDAGLFTAVMGNRMIGVILVLIRKTAGNSILSPRRYAWIGDLVISKGFRRLGVGRSLVEKAHQWSLDKGITEIELDVYEFNKEAIIFFRMLEYQTIKRTMRRALR